MLLGLDSCLPPANWPGLWDTWMFGVREVEKAARVQGPQEGPGLPGAGRILWDPAGSPRGGWASWTLTVFARDAWQPCIHPSLVNMSIEAQDVHLVMLWRQVGTHHHEAPSRLRAGQAALFSPDSRTLPGAGLHPGRAPG